MTGEHERKPKDQEILQRFAQAIGGKKPAWDLGCGPGQTTKYLRNVDFMSFATDFIANSLNESGFEKIEISEREPYAEVEYESRRAYVFAEKPGGR